MTLMQKITLLIIIWIFIVKSAINSVEINDKMRDKVETQTVQVGKSIKLNNHNH